MRRCLQGRELHEAVAQILGEHLDPESHRAWIVGSEAREQALPGSDVDIAIEGPGPIDLERMYELRDALERLPTLRSFDLVDLGRVTPSFRREALSCSKTLPLGSPSGWASRDVEE